MCLRLKPTPGWSHPEGLQSRRILRASLQLKRMCMSAPRKMLRKLNMTPCLRDANFKLSHTRSSRLGFALVVFLSLAASAQSRTDCNVIESRILKQSVHYCVQLPPDYDANGAKRHYPVLYFLHGLGQSEQTLFSTGGWSVVEDLWRQHKIIDF